MTPATTLPTPLGEILVRYGRSGIEQVIERLIEVLDVIDGDPDDEPEEDRCTAADDGLAPIWVNGHLWWGTADEAGGLQMPSYGVDQSRGPIGELVAHRARVQGLGR